MERQSKLRVFYLAEILSEFTDEQHSLSINELCNILKDKYEIEAYRQTIQDDIEVLRQTGLDIDCERSVQNRYRILNRQFDITELKLLIDAVQSSKFITKKKSDELVKKLSQFTSCYLEKTLKRHLAVDGRIKQEKETVFYTVDTIHTAINQRKKLKFQMDDYTLNKKRILHNQGEFYIFSPWSLVWDGDYYYVVGWSDKYRGIGSHRVDRIHKGAVILDDDWTGPSADFDINKYINTMFHMYSSPRKTVRLICENGTINAVIDRFGRDVDIEIVDKDHFSVTAEIAVGTVFYSWVFGFSGKVRITGPNEVREEYLKMVKKAVEDQ